MRWSEFLRSRDRAVDGDATEESEERLAEQIVSIPISEIRPNPYQPRREFDPAGLAELARSIEANGLLQPIVVRPAGRGYQLLMGERRLRACKALGMEQVPAIVRSADDKEAAVVALIENVQREDLTLFDQVEALRRLSQDFGLTQRELAEALGLSQSAIANKLRLLKLSPEAREIISREMLTERHARALLAFEDAEDQVRGARYIADKKLNVKQAEAWIEAQLEAREVSKRKQRIRGVYKDARLFINSVRALVHQLEEAGIGVELDEESTSEYVEVRVRIQTRRGDG